MNLLRYLANEVSVSIRAFGTSSVYQSFSLSVSLTMTAERHDRLLSFLDNIPYSYRPSYIYCIEIFPLFILNPIKNVNASGTVSLCVWIFPKPVCGQNISQKIKDSMICHFCLFFPRIFNGKLTKWHKSSNVCNIVLGLYFFIRLFLKYLHKS